MGKLSSEQIDICKEVIADYENGKYESILSSIEAKQKQAKEAGQAAVEEILGLLWGIFSMFFHFPAGQKHPFGPLATFTDGSRTMLPEDLSEDKLLLIEELSQTFQNPEFSARVYDILWIRKKHHQYARKAFNAYLELIRGKKGTTVWPTLRNWLKRATQIALDLGDKAPERTTIKTRLNELFEDSKAIYKSAELRYWPDAILDIIYEYKLSDNWEELGNKAKEIAESFNDQYDEARAYYENAAKFYRRAGNSDKERNSKLIIAQLWEKEAQAHTDSFLKADRFEHAIEAYRNVGGESEKVEQMIRELKEAKQQMVSQMKPISVPVQTSGLIKVAEDALAGKKGIDALQAFVSIFPPQSYERAKKKSEESLQEHPLQSLIRHSVVTSEGNTAANLPGMHDNNGQDRINAEIIRSYNLGQGLIGSTTLKKAVDLITTNDPDWEKVIRDFISDSEFISEDRVGLYEKAIIAGFKGDMVTFIHMVIPQIENSIRLIFYKNGLKTTKALPSGVQRERDLDDLLGDPNAETIFGKDLLWEMRSLMIEQAGPNIRNRLCHGLMSESDFHSPYSIYLLWLALVLIAAFKKVN